MGRVPVSAHTILIVASIYFWIECLFDVVRTFLALAEAKPGLMIAQGLAAAGSATFAAGLWGMA